MHSDEIKFVNGLWRAKLKPNNADLLIMGNQNQMCINGDTFLAIEKKLESLISKATGFAHESAYHIEIAERGGIVLESIVIESPTRIRIWFEFNNVNKMLGVLLENESVTGIHCDT